MGHGVLDESYLTDSGAFSAAKFVKQIRDHSQRIRYCGTNAHHKNGVAERGVQKVSNMARAMILHSAAHWKDGILHYGQWQSPTQRICTIIYQMNKAYVLLTLFWQYRSPSSSS